MIVFKESQGPLFDRLRVNGLTYRLRVRMARSAAGGASVASGCVFVIASGKATKQSGIGHICVMPKEQKCATMQEIGFFATPKVQLSSRGELDVRVG